MCDSTVYVEAEGKSIAITVTDYDGSKREYRADVRLVATSTPEMRTLPAESGVRAPGRERSEQPNR
ncbi:hypothetical protein [Mycobacteroides chelonae]|uniref:hypothetical protein n=1 Tax=Mycobacteroides chelonae TaxID=1774 RepID=UPI001F2B2DAF|nr:hypothetical protein [Mycobacteroides chelonae]